MEKIFDVGAYQKIPQMVLGFHGCDKSVAKKIINSATEHLIPSQNEYDWLGNGIYFWQNDPVRAFEWAKERKSVKNPAVVGAVIDLGLCLNFAERYAIELLQRSYAELKGVLSDDKKNRVTDKGGFNLVRPLDCLVIENVHKMMRNSGVSFDTVCGYFQEGGNTYPGTDLKEKSHVQICVRNVKCIKGYFLPREK